MRLAGITVKPDAVNSNTAGEYLTRFLFGGVTCMIAGVAGNHFGPVVAGLLMAFPAIYPASITLLIDHEKQKRANAGLDGTKRGRLLAAMDSQGTTFGCVGLMVFGLAMWKLLARSGMGWSMVVATVAWFVAAALCWQIQRRI
jgi:hypothetical protein